jgi:sec-independent protein translocase protein TatC
VANEDAKGTAKEKGGASPGEMTLFEHLAELRSVLIQSLIAIAAASVLAWFISEQALDLLVKPAVGPSGPLVFLSPTGAFMMRLKLAFGLGAFLAAPIVVWRLWAFVVPGLLRRERKVLFPVVLSSVVLFYLGAAFAYLVILPISLRFLMGFSTENLRPMLAGEQYFAFAIRLTLAFGAVFQFPLVVSLLTYWEILGPDFLKKYWRYGVVLVFVLSAILTPPDVASQILMAGPVLFLYFLSLWLAQMIARNRKRESEASGVRDAEDERE